MNKVDLSELRNELLAKFENSMTREQWEQIEHYEALRKHCAISYREIAKEVGLEVSSLARYMQMRKKAGESFQSKHVDPKKRLDAVGRAYINTIFNKLKLVIDSLSGQA